MEETSSESEDHFSSAEDEEFEAMMGHIVYFRGQKVMWWSLLPQESYR